MSTPDEVVAATPAVESTPAPAAAVEAAAAPAAEPAAAAAASSEAAAEEDKVEEADSTAEYTALVQLKPIEVLTGEEQDEVLYKHDSTSWKERGRGDVKLLQNKETKSIRILLRQEKTLKLCMNHKVHPEIDLVPNAGSDRSWTWRTVDYSTDEAEKQTFALRFKDAETANAFKAKYDECRVSNGKQDADKPAPAEPSA